MCVYHSLRSHRHSLQIFVWPQQFCFLPFSTIKFSGYLIDTILYVTLFSSIQVLLFFICLGRNSLVIIYIVVVCTMFWSLRPKISDIFMFENKKNITYFGPEGVCIREYIALCVLSVINISYVKKWECLRWPHGSHGDDYVVLSYTTINQKLFSLYWLI